MKQINEKILNVFGYTLDGLMVADGNTGISEIIKFKNGIQYKFKNRRVTVFEGQKKDIGISLKSFDKEKLEKETCFSFKNKGVTETGLFKYNESIMFGVDNQDSGENDANEIEE